MEDPSNYQSNLEDNIELRKIVSKLEDLLEKKQSEIDSLVKIHQDLKSLHEKTRKECTDLNQKLISTYTEKSTMEKKYEAEIQRLKTYFEKQKDVYEQQILKLSQFDSESLKNKITAEVEIKYKHVLSQKDLEIENLNDQLFDIKKKNELIITEYETFKIDATRELESMKENRKAEINDLMFKIQLLNEKADTNVDKESYRSLRQEVETYRRQFSDLQNEIANLRKEKEMLFMERNEAKMGMLKELDQEKMKAKMVLNDNERFSQMLKSYENELFTYKQKLEEKSEEIKVLMEERITSVKDLRNKENEFENFKSEIRILRQKIEDRDHEVDDTLNNAHEREKQRFLQEKIQQEEYQKKIEELTTELKDIQINFKNYHEKTSEELHCARRDYYIVQEEKRMLIKRQTELQQDLEYIRDDYEKKCKGISYYEREYGSLDEKYRDLAAREAENHRGRMSTESVINEKNKEIEHLNGYLTNLKLENGTMAEKLKSEYNRKYQELLKKKKYYKKQCIVYNQNLASIIQKLKPNQQRELNINLDNDLLKMNNDNISQSEESVN